MNEVLLNYVSLFSFAVVGCYEFHAAGFRCYCGNYFI